MTGRPAETWKKFNFATPPQWAYALLILACLGGIGIIAYAVVMAAIAQRASGFLPLTRGSRSAVDLAFWVPIGLMGLSLVMWIAAAIIGLGSLDPTRDTIGAVLFWLGLLVLIAGIVGRLVITPLVGPRAKVREQIPGQYDKLVELRNVNPAFVAAVRQMHAGWASQEAPLPPMSGAPPLPGSI